MILMMTTRLTSSRLVTFLFVLVGSDALDEAGNLNLLRNYKRFNHDQQRGIVPSLICERCDESR